MNAGTMGCLGQALSGLFLPHRVRFFHRPLLLVAVLNWPQIYGYLAGAVVGIAVERHRARSCHFWLVRKRVERLDEN